MNSFAKFISYLFHPLVFAIHVPFLILYHTTGSALYSLKWTLFSSFFIFIGMALFYLLHPEEFMTDVDITKRETRIAFYTIGCLIAIVYFLVAVLFKGIFFPLSIVSLGMLIGLLILEISSFYTKISIHVAVVCAYTITIGFLYGTGAFLLVWWLVPLIAWARIVLKKHTYMEVFAGACVGSFITALTFSVEKLLS